MIEQDIAQLWARAAERKTPWDAAAARAELRALGLNPNSPPPPVETKAEPAGEPSHAAGDDGAAPAVPAPAPARKRAKATRGKPRPPKAPLRAVPEAEGDAAAPLDRDPAPAGEGALAAPPAAGEGHSPRHNQWTPERMSAFLGELAVCQNVSQAARSVGMSRQSAYKLRDRLADKAFALAWDVALESGLQQLAHALMDRAVNGEEVAVFYQGEQVGTRRRFDNRLATWLLENSFQLGRNVPARRVAAQDWDGLLRRVEREARSR